MNSVDVSAGSVGISLDQKSQEESLHRFSFKIGLRKDLDELRLADSS